MKIIHVITRLILGGAQENTVLTCLAQAHLGHDVVLLSGPPLGPEGSLLDWAAGLPFRTVLVPEMRRPVHPYRDLVAYHDLAKHLRDERPDVVHTHSSKAGVLGRRAAAAVGVGCIVHTIHGLAFDAYRSRAAGAVYRLAERRAGRWSHRLVAVCERMADRAAEAGLAPRDRIDVVYSGMDAARFRAAAAERARVRRAWGVGETDFVFLKLARLFPMKGHRFVLPALAEVARRHPRVVLVLAGEGVLRRRLEREARRLGVGDRVRFLGLVPRERVPGILWAADAVVHAGLREGLARVLPQAGLCRRPVVTYNVGGAAEVVRDGVNGYLLPAPVAQRGKALVPGGSTHPPGTRDTDDSGAVGTETHRAESSVAALAEAMGRLAADPAGARAMGRRWSADDLDRFDYHRATREIMQVYARAGRV